MGVAVTDALGAAEVVELLDESARLGLRGMRLLDALPFDDVVSAYNGIGPDWFPVCIRRTLDYLFPEHRPAAMVHDVMLSCFPQRRADEECLRTWFAFANDALADNMRKCADDRYPCWYAPRRWASRFAAWAFPLLCRMFGWTSFAKSSIDSSAIGEEGCVRQPEIQTRQQGGYL